MHKYLGIFIWYEGTGFSCSEHFDTDDKAIIVDSLSRKVDMPNLDWAEILVVENTSEGPSVIHHWSAANGDFGEVA